MKNYICVDTFFECAFLDNNGEIFKETFGAHHTVIDKNCDEKFFKKKIYMYGVDHAFEIANDKNYEVVYVRISNQTTWLECFKETEV